jgi:hypothetical protein
LEHPEITQFDRHIVRQAVGNMIERALHDLKNVMLHHPRLVADGHDNVPLG